MKFYKHFYRVKLDEILLALYGYKELSAKMLHKLRSVFKIE
tara:strand:+ start:391 stop:513 length:123 start_codon:yes stop_codon:yes gene_type:complete